MTANEGFDLLMKMEGKHRKHLITGETIACVVARAGAPDEMILANTIHELQQKDFGPPLHTLVIPGNFHFMEIEALELFAGLPHETGRKIQKL
jgi:diphthine synthase